MLQPQSSIQGLVYEAAERPQVSALTGVDTGVEVIAPEADSDCCPSFFEEFILFDALGNSVSRHAAKYPWGGVTESDGSLVTCNVCPYGPAWAQGTWVDVDDFTTSTEYLAQANRLDFDGNTFRWRYKNRKTGHWVDFRGYIFCPVTASGEMGYSALVPLQVERGDGATCEVPRRAGPSEAEPFPEIHEGEAIHVLSGLTYYAPTEQTLPVLTVDDPSALGRNLDRYFCNPGSDIGSLPDDSGRILPCPEIQEFSDCWDAN